MISDLFDREQRTVTKPNAQLALCDYAGSPSALAKYRGPPPPVPCLEPPPRRLNGKQHSNPKLPADISTASGSQDPQIRPAEILDDNNSAKPEEEAVPAPAPKDTMTDAAQRALKRSLDTQVGNAVKLQKLASPAIPTSLKHFQEDSEDEADKE